MMRRAILSLAVAAPLAFAQFGGFFKKETFVPTNRLSGVGVDRERMSEGVLNRRSQLMIESQTFTILRDPEALAGAERITSPRLWSLFERAGQQSGLPASFVAAISYLESWGKANAESPAGPKGIMQIAGGTARAMGLRMIYATKYRTSTERRMVKRKKGKPVWQNVKRRIPYSVLVKDERLDPDRAIPAAAQYLSRLENRYGGRDWAVFAYHCGEGCAAAVRALAQRSEGLGDSPSVAQVFFGASPSHNRELYQSLQYHMERDYSPTYFFRISRAEQLLKLYREDPEQFKTQFYQYRNQVDPKVRAPHRLSVWLRPEDLAFKNCEDLRREKGKSLVEAFEDPRFFGFSLRRAGPGAIGEDDPANRDLYFQAAPSTIGTIAYIAFETRRLFEAMNNRRESWAPMEITALVEPLDYEERAGRRGVARKGEMPAHCSGQVFDISLQNLSPGQREALDFVLDDLGWLGYIGFVRESTHADVTHVGPAPTAREFFTKVYQEAVAAKSN
ncbi:MAG TPA: transglycosylase SLT domain-containing protein [Bryobacteraceae bacterium]|nr:transglycosylase SLT domain-containing protein [Bryobacteraceae bacterium]